MNAPLDVPDPDPTGDGPTRRRLPPTAVAAALVILAGTALRLAVAGAGWFYWDDLVLHSHAAGYRLPGADLLLTDHDGHLMPGGMLLAWLAAHLAPLDFRLPLLQIAVLDLLAGAALARMLWILTRGRPVLLVPLVAASITPLALPAATWWAAALTALPLAATMSWAAGSTVAAARTGRRRHAVGAVVATATGLFFVEKALLVPVVAALVLLGWWWVDPDAPAPRRLLARTRVAWIGMPAVVALWLPVYLTTVGSPGAERPATGPVVGVWTLIDHAYRLALVPALAGGPWTWQRWHPGPPWADAGPAAVALGVVTVLAVVGVSLGTRRRTAPIWGVAAAYPLLSVLAVALVRTGPDTAPEIMQTLRYHADAVPVLAAAGALALVAPARSTPRRSRTLSRGAGAIAVAALVIGSLVSADGYRRVWADQPSRDYLQPLVAALRERGTAILDRPVPPEVLLPVVGPAHHLSTLLAGVPGLPEIGDVTDDPVLIDAHGRMHPAAPVGGRMIDPGTQPGCGHRIGERGARLDLDGPLMDRDWIVQLNYFASDAGSTTVRLDTGRPTRVPLRPGLNTTYARVVGSGTGVEIGPPVDAGGHPVELCIGAGPVAVLLPR